MSGQELGRYRLAAPAEAGTLVRAEDTLVGRQVDLQLVPAAAAADPARLERIRQQVERAAAFVHPDVATMYELEESDGQLFVTLEPLVGKSLTSILAEGGVPIQTSLEVALALSDVLAGAKDAGVIHGGLHPGDVVLADDGTITVRGFGLHELRQAAEEEIGEPSPAAGYRPPETAPGLLPDHRADLFALGRILQEMVAAGAEERLPETVASGLQRVLDLCLSEDPAQRPHSASELRQPLEELQRELLREPEPETEEEAPERRLGAPARWGMLAAGLLLALIVAWVLWLSLGRSERPGEAVVETDVAAAATVLVDLAVMPFVGPEKPADRWLARGFGHEVTRLLEHQKRLSVIAAASSAAAATGEATAEQLGDRLGVAHLLEGSFLWQRDAEISRAEVTVRLSRTSDGELLWSETLEGFFGEIVGLQNRVALGVVRRLGAGGRPGAQLPLTPSLGAYEAYLEAVGRTAEAASPDQLRAAAAGFEQASILDPGLLLAHTGQVGLQVGLAATEPVAEPLAAARQSLAAAREIDAEDFEVRRVAGQLELASGGDSAVALEELKAALERSPGHPDLLRAVALIDRRQGRWDEAIEGLTAARRRDPLDLGLLVEQVETLAWKRRFEEAAEQVGRLRTHLPNATEPGLLQADLLVRGQGATERSRAVLEQMPEGVRSDPRWQQRMLRLDLYDGGYEAALARLPSLELEETEELIERAWIHHHMGLRRRAATGFEKARERLDDRLAAAPGDPRLSGLLGQAYAGTGGGRLGIRMGQRAVAQLPVTGNAVAGAEQVERLARICVLAGESEQALDELAFLLEIPSPVTVAVLRLDPVWGPLRSEPRFRDLLERFGP